MMVFIVGKPGSGKSAYAEKLACELADDEKEITRDPAGDGDRPACGIADAGKKLYIATMIPFGEEGRERVKKHRKMREGKGFDTIEKPCGLDELRDEIRQYEDGVCLLECIANLVGNELHAPAHSGWSQEALALFIADEVRHLSERVRNLVVVSDIFELSEETDAPTREYISLVHCVNSLIKNMADRFISI